MKVLLDTHTFLWAIIDEKKLSPRVRRVMASSELWWSVVSLWEAIQKAQVGKLSLPLPAGPFLTDELSSNHVRLLPVSLSHVLRVEELPLHHRDPFDRLLIAQSIEEGWPIVTGDPWFARYPVDVIW
ncbi:MAG TPA: type II toxin-antitoxin system VapC family toxin [Terriglobales bacterium]|nr:type II toxin-antitoxin system VapC family toxin [Terriglobales bacterium]